MAKFSLDTKLADEDKVYGTATVGARGQLVIPMQARKDLRIKAGDRMVVMGKMGKALGLVKTSELSQVIETIMSHVTASSRVKKELQHKIHAILGSTIKSNRS